MLLWLRNNAAILIAVGVSILTGLFTLVFLVLFVFPLTHNKEKRIAVLVLGDVGRSPRMQNHAVSLAKAGWQVDLLGLKGAELFSDVLALEDKIHLHYLPSTPKVLTKGGKALFIVFGPLKVLFQIYSLLHLLLTIPQPSYILIQNPPSIPTIVIARFVCTLRSARLVIDWHNLGYTLLSLRLSPSHPLVHIHRIYEHLFSKGAYAHFCVTNLMKHHLTTNYGLQNVTVLMDRPPDRYKPLNEPAQELFLETLPETRGFDPKTAKLLVTSTSYTADEPLQPLLDALVKYSESSNSALPRILLLITGRGPMQGLYLSRIADLHLSDEEGKCIVKTVWLQPEDYPKLLACADLGISLHTSSSGMDFPMKIVDLFGCGVPVCAVNFPAVGEVVKDGVNGVVFNDSDELYEILIKLLSHDEELGRLRKGVKNLGWEAWSEEWDKLAKPVFA